MRLAVVGVLAGGSISGALGGLLSRVMFGVSPGDPRLLAVTALLLPGTAGLAAWLPGRRAARTDPLIALASE